MSTEPSALRDALVVAARLARSVTLSLEDLAAIKPITEASLERLTRAQEKDVLAFLKSFEQFQDTLSRRLLRLCLIAGGDDVTGMSARTAFDRAESLGILRDATAFFAAQSVRNRIAHEYAMSGAKRAERINAAAEAAGVLLREYETIVAYATRLEGGLS